VVREVTLTVPPADPDGAHTRAYVRGALAHWRVPEPAATAVEEAAAGLTEQATSSAAQDSRRPLVRAGRHPSDRVQLAVRLGPDAVLVQVRAAGGLRSARVPLAAEPRPMTRP
jgi:hypothetical protein